MGAPGNRQRALWLACLLALLPWGPLAAVEFEMTITQADLRPIVGNIVGSGRNTLDIQLFNNNIEDNRWSSYDFDDTHLVTTQSGYAGAYITSFGELREFHRVTFPDPYNPTGSAVNVLGLTIDVTGSGDGANPPSMTFSDLQIFGLSVDNDGAGSDTGLTTAQLTAIFGAGAPTGLFDPLATDLSSANQSWVTSISSIANAVGTYPENVLALSANSGAITVTETNEGTGWADGMINTHMRLFDERFDDSDIVVIWVSTSSNDEGMDEIFIADKITLNDLDIPEPSALLLAALSAVGALGRRRQRRRGC